MLNKKLYIPILIITVLFAASCASTNITKYYSEHKQMLDSIDQSYRQQYKQRSFSILFTDKSFKHISIEITTDSINYIYEFSLTDTRLKDTLLKYNLPVTEMEELMAAMKSIKCLWVGNLDYYEGGKQNSLVYMSIRSKSFRLPFVDKKYYILTYYSQPQYYDNEGRLLDRRRRRQLRKINNDIFRRINDKVCYTVSNVFR